MATKLCKCNTCEAIIERTIAYYGKMIADKECILCAVATARTMGIVCEMVIEQQVRGLTAEKFKNAPSAVYEIMVQEGIDHTFRHVSQSIQEVWDGDAEHFVQALNAHIDRANKAHEEEQNLPKDT